MLRLGLSLSLALVLSATYAQDTPDPADPADPVISPFLQALLPDFSPEFACLDVSYTDVASAVDNVVFVTYSSAWCAPFNDPIGCLSNPGSPCYPQGEGLVTARIDKYNLACNDSMPFNDCVSAVINRTDAFMMSALGGPASLSKILDGTVGYKAVDGEPPVTVQGYPPGPLLPISIFTGDVISRPNLHVQGYPSDMKDHAMFDTRPYFTNDNPLDCRGITVTGANVTLDRVGSAASVVCSSNLGSQFVRDFVLLRDTVVGFACTDCSVYYPNASISARHVGLYLASGGGSPLMNITDPDENTDTLSVSLSDWNMTNDIMLWAGAVTGLDNIAIRTASGTMGLLLISSPDSGIWTPGMLNVTSLISSTTLYTRSAACPSTSLLHDAIIGGFSALGGIMLMGLVMGLHGYFKREHEHSRTHVKHMVKAPAANKPPSAKPDTPGLPKQPVRLAAPAPTRRRIMRSGAS